MITSKTLKRSVFSNQGEVSVTKRLKTNDPSPNGSVSSFSLEDCDSEVPVVLSVQLRRTLHEFIGKASEQQLLTSMLKASIPKIRTIVDKSIAQMEKEVNKVLAASFGDCFSLSTSTQTPDQKCHDILLKSFEQSMTSQLLCHPRVDSMRQSAHQSIIRMGRRDRIAFGRELQLNGIHESEFTAPLPLFAWFNILKYMNISELLNSLCRVNRAWFRACTHDRLWRMLYSISFGNQLPSFQELSLIFKKLPNLKHIRFVSGNCSDKVLDHLTLNCALIRSIALPNSHEVSDSGIRLLAERCPRLTDLDIENCAKVSNEGILSLSRYCSKLLNVSLKYCRAVSDQGICGLALGCQSLRSINLNYCPISDSAIEAIARSCTRLEELSLKYCRSITDFGLAAIASNCANLKVLTLSYCHQVTDKGLKSLASHCSLLARLNLKYCRNVSNEGIAEIASSCSELVDINLNYCILLSDEALLAIGKSCSKLQILKMDYCEGISDEGLNGLFEGCSELTSLSIEYCPGISDITLMKLSFNCPLIRSLNFGNCVLLSNEGLIALSKRCAMISKLNLNGCKRISDVGLLSLIKPNKTCLSKLVVSNCPMVSENARHLLSSKGIKLE